LTIISVSELNKSYKNTRAVNNISFNVADSEIFGMVGPNGAGKTTTIECIEGLRKPDKGELTVLDYDPIKDRHILRQRIGIQLQEAQLPERIKVKEALDLFSSFYKTTLDWYPLLSTFELETKKNSFFSELSGGQKQRLFIILALINDPEIVFLDELTTGLDPQARRRMWELVKEIRDKGKTVFLTTHYMEEAEYLCDRVAIIDNGKIIALDSPEKLISKYGSTNQIIFETSYKHIDFLKTTVKGVLKITRSNNYVIIHGKGKKILSDVVNNLEKSNIKYNNLKTKNPNLEDVFLSLTGRKIRE